MLSSESSTRSCLSFAAEDLKTPASKGAILAGAGKEVARVGKLYHYEVIAEHKRL